MTSHPIIMSAQSVRATMDGSKMWRVIAYKVVGE